MSSAPAAAGGGAPVEDGPIRCAVLLFPGHEPLDWVGPVNIFGAVGKWPPPQPGAAAPRGRVVEILYVAQERGPVTSVTGARVFCESAPGSDRRAGARGRHRKRGARPERGCREAIATGRRGRRSPTRRAPRPAALSPSTPQEP
jgi:hypothetical protein